MVLFTLLLRKAAIEMELVPAAPLVVPEALIVDLAISNNNNNNPLAPMAGHH